MSSDGVNEYYKEFTRDQLVKELSNIEKCCNELIDENRELKLQNEELIAHQNEQKITDWTLRSLRAQIASLEEKYKEYQLDTVTTPRMLMMMSCQNPYIIDI